MELGRLLGELLVGLVVAVVASLVTVRLSLKRFYAERWWDRKADAYTRVIAALHQMNGRALPDQLPISNFRE